MGVWVGISRSKVVVVAVGLACTAVGFVVLANAGSARTSAGFHPASERGCVNNPSVISSPQCVLTGGRIGRRGRAFKLSPPGSVVRPSAVFGDRVFLNADEGVALANGDNAQYPVLSTNGGRVWRIDGPQLHVDAADGPEAVGFVGIAGPGTFFAYGSSVVDVTTDRGRTWWETYLGEQVVAVVPGYRNQLVAYVEQSVSNQHLNPAVTWQYVSADGGRHWHYSTDFAVIPG